MKVGEPAGTWTPAVAATTFTQQYTAHPNINAVVTPNDDNANAVIAQLQALEDPAEDVPDHRSGRLAVRPAEHPEGLPVRHGLQADLPRGAGRSCRRPVPPGRREPPDGAGQRRRPTTTATPTSRRCCSTPKWVTTENMADTVVKDQCGHGGRAVRLGSRGRVLRGRDQLSRRRRRVHRRSGRQPTDAGAGAAPLLRLRGVEQALRRRPGAEPTSTSTSPPARSPRWPATTAPASRC